MSADAVVTAAQNLLSLLGMNNGYDTEKRLKRELADAIETYQKGECSACGCPLHPGVHCYDAHLRSHERDT